MTSKPSHKTTRKAIRAKPDKSTALPTDPKRPSPHGGSLEALEGKAKKTVTALANIGEALAPVSVRKCSAVKVSVAPGSSEGEVAEAVARTLTKPETSAAAVIENWQQDTHDVNALAAELNRQIDAVVGGDLRRVEGMLIAQAHTLDNIFANLARRATNQEYLRQWDTYMRMAMKAQNQCRMTLETLATIKNPPTVFAKQANINNGGQQQVNNGSAPTSAGSFAPALESETEPIGLLEASNGQRMDAGAQGKAGRAHSDLEAVGAIDRAKDGRR